jgi:hypothetical protein
LFWRMTLTYLAKKAFFFTFSSLHSAQVF